MSARRSRLRSLALMLVLVSALALALAGAGLSWRLLLGGNRHTVIPEKIYRSAQPSAAQLESWADELQLRSVLNLKGSQERSSASSDEGVELSLAEGGARPLERYFVRLSARRWPSPRELGSLIDALDHAARPTLIHCESGVDRSGLAAAVALLLEGRSPDVARGQFSLRFGHPGERIGSDLPGVIDAYRDWLQTRARPHTPETFRSWVEDHYVAYFYEAELELVRVPDPVAAGERVSFDVRATNRSPQPIPLGCEPEGVRVAVRITSRPPLAPFLLEQRSCVPAPPEALAPGASFEARVHGFEMPEPGGYEMMVDLVDEKNEHYFGDMGSPVLRRPLTIH